MAELTPEQVAKNAQIEADKKAAIAGIESDYDSSIQRMELNKANALKRAADAAAKGDTKYQDRWLASAARYDTLIGIKENLLASKIKITNQQFDLKKEKPVVMSWIVPPSGTSSTPFRLPPSERPVSPTPPTTPSAPPPPPPPPVKTAPLDTILYEEDPVPIEIMADILFENIGGQELINIARNDIVNGQKVVYQPIKNLNSIQQEYNPNNILALQDASPQIFGNYPIKLEEKIPNVGNGPDGSNVYINSLGELVIEVINMAKDEQVEVEITQGGTIYEVQL